MTPALRDYQAIAHGVRTIARDATVEERMRRTVDALWDSLHDRGVSWVGFYIDHPREPDDRRLTLGPCRDKPACSPIGLHGVCGQALLSRSVRIVRDVAELGPNYIACDPRDRSEIVVPLLNGHGDCWAVLDMDSWEVEAFDQADASGLGTVLRAAGMVV